MTMSSNRHHVIASCPSGTAAEQLPVAHDGRVTRPRSAVRSLAAATFAAGVVASTLAFSPAAQAANENSWAISRPTTGGTTFLPGDSVELVGRMVFDGPDDVLGSFSNFSAMQDDVFLSPIECYRTENGVGATSDQSTTVTLSSTFNADTWALPFTGPNPGAMYFSPDVFDGTVTLPTGLPAGAYTVTMSCTDIGPDAEVATDDTVVSTSRTLQVADIGLAVAPAQPDPAFPIDGDIEFDVTFPFDTDGEFDETDVTLGGTAGATTVTITGSGTSFRLSVSGMTRTGSVTASISALAVYGETSPASATRSVAYRIPVPTTTQPTTMVPDTTIAITTTTTTPTTTPTTATTIATTTIVATATTEVALLVPVLEPAIPQIDTTTTLNPPATSGLIESSTLDLPGTTLAAKAFDEVPAQQVDPVAPIIGGINTPAVDDLALTGTAPERLGLLGVLFLAVGSIVSIRGRKRAEQA